jgi:outer membrane protein
VTGLHLESSSVGLALQAGFDVKLDKQLYFNVDLKKVQIRSDVNNDAGAKVSRVKVDPFLLGIGLGYRF